MEGQIVKCESSSGNNVITASHISDNNRFYLPEYRIAENGIFVYNVLNSSDEGAMWQKVDNLNIQPHDSKVFKFGYDSYEGRPYLEFPEDWGSLIEDGLFIYYTRTSGVNGNISYNSLTQFELPNATNWDKVSLESFSVTNYFAAESGADIETIGQAYNNFKKTVGTFETLVTCRDYMNKICTLLSDDYSGKYLVSNALVTDIRNDLNRAITICSCDHAGIFYKETSLVTEQPATSVTTESVDIRTKPVYSSKASKKQFNGVDISTNWYLGNSDNGIPLFDITEIVSGENASLFDLSKDGEVFVPTNDQMSDQLYWHIKQEDNNGNDLEFVSKWPVIKQVTVEKIKEAPTRAIDHFDLVLYPFKSYNQIKNISTKVKEEYDASFKYSQSSFDQIKRLFTDTDAAEQLTGSNVVAHTPNFVVNTKTIAHNIISPRKADIISINNYLKLKAIISTTAKINESEGNTLIGKIKIALANAFNMRELDFGEEIPFDSILNVIKNADNRISVVSLAEPALYTTFSVFEGLDSSFNPIIKEYAVASSELPENENIIVDTEEAKKIYNKLAVRNVLAGRVPLFDYNTTFKSDFSEAPYRVTEEIAEEELPEEVVAHFKGIEEPFKIYFYNNVIYTEQCINQAIRYTKTYTPDEYALNVIAKNKDDNTNFNKITTSCKVKVPDGADRIKDVELAEGEFIRFRAPNFITDKTFPAYVNYHLHLNNEIRTEASTARADTLYTLLSSETSREQSLKYFNTPENHSDNKKHTKTFILRRTVLKTPESEAKSDAGKTETPEDTNLYVIVVDQETGAEKTTTVRDILLESGFVKLVNAIPSLKYGEEDVSDQFSEVSKLPEIDLKIGNENGESTSFITDESTLPVIQKKIDEWLNSPINSDDPDDSGDNSSTDKETVYDYIPEDTCLTIEYTFEYMPFNTNTLQLWERFLAEKGNEIFGFSPAAEGGRRLWYTYSTWAELGKYVLLLGQDCYKLKPFTAARFESIQAAKNGSNYLAYVYIAQDLGADLLPNFISNDEEYMLQQGERLYIEYTPSTTTEDGVTKSESAVQEIYEAGTIIKPSGFVDGLKDSSKLGETGKTAYKNVDFATTTITKADVPMYSLGASEQIEIRELARVVLSKKTLSKSNGSETKCFFLYKNFNKCPELEATSTVNEEGKRVYTLKDGEYICYTDENKADIAYYASGTQVILTGNIVIPEFDLQTISTESIFDSNPNDIPWKRYYLTNDQDSIIFQEFQYITLGAGDTLNELELTGDIAYLDEQWRPCTGEVKYTVSGAKDTTSLDKININTADQTGYSWEVCSILDLGSSPAKSQILRTTDKIETSVTLHKEHSSGIGAEQLTIKALDTSSPIAIKPNLSCFSSNSKLELDDNSLYNPNKLKSFEVKVFAKQDPIIVTTSKTAVNDAEHSLIPINTLPKVMTVDEHDQTNPASSDNKPIDILSWPSNDTEYLTGKLSNNIWSRVELAKLNASSDEYDYALKLPVCLLPDTYGIFSIYLNYPNSDTLNKPTWIELLPGYTKEDISLINIDAAKDTNWDTSGSSLKLILKPGINCIKVNKSCDLFIKTLIEADASDIDSSLFFDDLRLVKCNTIEYTENGQTKIKNTNGINLTQLGYLDAYGINIPSDIADDKVKSSIYYDLMLEEQLLKEIRELDRDHEFYYNVPVESSVAINFNEGDSKLNTLLNPAINYDINNINNNFVISKLDIDSIDTGFKIAHSSKLNKT